MIDKQTYSGVLHPNDGSAVVELNLLDGTITLDDNWSPYAQATIVIPTPTSITLWDSRVPSNGSQPSRVTLTAFQEFCESEPMSTWTADFAHVSDITAAFAHCSDITAAMVNNLWGNPTTPAAVYRKFDLAIVNFAPQDDGTSEVTLTSDEHFATETQKPFQVAGDTTAIIDPTLPAVVNITGMGSLRQYIAGKLALWLYFLGAGLKFAPSSFDYDLGVLAAITPIVNPNYVPLWDFLAVYVTLTGGRLWCDETRTWHFESAPTSAPGTFTFDASASAITWRSSIGRDTTWYNEVAIVYSWTDAANVAHVQVDQATVAGFEFMERTLVQQSNVPYPGPGAAAALLARVITYGNDPTIEAVNDFSVTPGQPASIAMPTGDFTGVVGAVSWNIGKAEMSVTPRQLI